MEVWRDNTAPLTSLLLDFRFIVLVAERQDHKTIEQQSNIKQQDNNLEEKGIWWVRNK